MSKAAGILILLQPKLQVFTIAGKEDMAFFLVKMNAGQGGNAESFK